MNVNAYTNAVWSEQFYPLSLWPPPQQPARVPSHHDMPSHLPFPRQHLSLPSHAVKAEAQHMGPRMASQLGEAQVGMGADSHSRVPHSSVTLHPSRASSTRADVCFFLPHYKSIQQGSGSMTWYLQLLVNILIIIYSMWINKTICYQSSVHILIMHVPTLQYQMKRNQDLPSILRPSSDFAKYSLMQLLWDTRQMG